MRILSSEMEQLLQRCDVRAAINNAIDKWDGCSRIVIRTPTMERNHDRYNKTLTMSAEIYEKIREKLLKQLVYSEEAAEFRTIGRLLFSECDAPRAALAELDAKTFTEQ